MKIEYFNSKLDLGYCYFMDFTLIRPMTSCRKSEKTTTKMTRMKERKIKRQQTDKEKSNQQKIPNDSSNNEMGND